MDLKYCQHDALFQRWTNYSLQPFLYTCKIRMAFTFLKSCKNNNRKNIVGFPGGAVVKNPPANAGDKGWSPGLGRSHVPRSN